MKSETIRAALLWSSVALLASCGGERHGEAPEPAAVSAVVVTAERLTVPQVVHLRGSVEAENTASIAARLMARVTAIHVAPGDRVRRGQLLVSIDPQASDGQLEQAEGALGQARAALTLAERNYRRFEALAEEGAASELELDLARMQHEQALAAVRQAEGAVRAAAAVASDTSLTAPFAGRVVRKLVDAGELAAPGRPLLTLESAGRSRLVLSVPESVMSRARLETGRFLDLTIDTRPELGTLEGEIVEVDPTADPMTHSFGVELALPPGDLPSGTVGRATIELALRELVAVPADAILSQGGLTLVVTRDADGRTASRAVTLGGPLSENRVEVLSGLSGGESVLVGLDMLPPSGAPVDSRQGAS